MKSIPSFLRFTLHSSLFTLLIAGCRVSLSPVKNRLAVGAESYVFFDAEGEGGQGDLYAGVAGGGKSFRVTFSRVVESAPALSPDGSMVAFIRKRSAADSTEAQVWVMNLNTGAERNLGLGEGRRPIRLAWSRDGASILVRTGDGDFEFPAPPARGGAAKLKPPADRRADTLLSAGLGTPSLGVAAACDTGGGVCAFVGESPAVIAPGGRNPFRWGSDSVGYLVGNSILVRPLAGGSTRELRFADAPTGIETVTYFPGPVVTPAY